MADEGYVGTYQPIKIDDGSLMDLRKVAGPAPAQGKHWVMVNLDDGQLKWYKSSRRRNYSGQRRRSYGRNW